MSSEQRRLLSAKEFQTQLRDFFDYMEGFYWDDWFAMYPDNADLTQDVAANLTEAKHALLIALYLRSIQNMLYTLYSTVEYNKPGSIARQVYTILEDIGK
eukprot:9971-Rhodomonas_salina.1